MSYAELLITRCKPKTRLLKLALTNLVHSSYQARDNETV